MATITIDGKEYDADKLSNETKNTLGILQFTDSEIQRLQGRLAAMQTARNAYVGSLKTLLEKEQSTGAAATVNPQTGSLDFSKF